MKMSLKLMEPGRIVCMFMAGLFLVGIADCIYMWSVLDWRGRHLVRHGLVFLTIWDSLGFLTCISLLFPPRFRPWRLLWRVTMYPSKRRPRRPKAPPPRSQPRSDSFPTNDA